MESDKHSELISSKSLDKSLKEKSALSLMVPSLVEEEDNEDEINQLLIKTGGFGRLQIIMIIALLFWYQGISFFLYGLPFFELVPKIMWQKGALEVFESWGTEDICVSGNLIDKTKWYVDYSDSESFHNWMTDYDLYWDSSFMIGLFGSTFFVGFTL